MNLALLPLEDQQGDDALSGTDLGTVPPLYVDASRDGFQPAKVSVHVQGVVLRIRSATCIVIEKRSPAASRRDARAGARRIRQRMASGWMVGKLR